MTWTAFIIGNEETIETLSETYERVDSSDVLSRAARFKITDPDSLFKTIKNENIIVRGIRMRPLEQTSNINRV